MQTTAPALPSRQSALMRLGVVLFAIGMLAVVAVFVLFAAGMENLPVWLSVVAGVITPLGLAVGLIGLVKEARKGSVEKAEKVDKATEKPAETAEAAQNEAAPKKAAPENDVEKKDADSAAKSG